MYSPVDSPGRPGPVPSGGRRPLRIGIEAHVVGRRQTGNERVVSNLILALSRLCEHEIIAYFTHPSAASLWRERGLPHLTIRLLRPAHPFVRIPAALPYRAARDRVDVLLSHVNRPPIAPCPVVTLVHDVAFARFPGSFSPYERIYMNRFIPFSIRHSKALVAVSQFTKDEIVALYGLPPDRITVAHNGVDEVFAARTARPSPIQPPFFLAVGNLEPRKNLLMLLRAYRRLVDMRPDVRERLVIVGKQGLGSERLQQESATLRDRGRILFTGYVGDDVMVGLLQRATALVYPSLYEGFGLPPLEAMAAGTPAAVSDIPVMREVVGPAGVLIPPTDEEGWAQEMFRLVSDPGLRGRLGELGRERAARFTWTASARSVLTALERATAAGR